MLGLFSEHEHRQLLGILGVALALVVVLSCIKSSRFTLDAIYQKNLNTLLIKEIGQWVLNRACVGASHWQFNQQASVSVNVSVIQLMDDEFIRG